ncbi:MAG: hypothetical protein PWP23_3328 [Candidatus Sumerlaeota bacterium]|nr:hypothetical protein [Candidatus Sumerlaeota bacterium]
MKLRLVLVLGLAMTMGGCVAKGRPKTDGGEGIVARNGAPDMTGMLRVAWRLQSQENVYGFNIYRGESEEGPWELVNPQPVPGHDTTSQPQSYHYFDEGLEIGRTYCYYVEEITFSGTTDKITPVMCGTAKHRQYYVEKGYLEAGK